MSIILSKFCLYDDDEKWYLVFQDTYNFWYINKLNFYDYPNLYNMSNNHLENRKFTPANKKKPPLWRFFCWIGRRIWSYEEVGWRQKIALRWAIFNDRQSFVFKWASVNEAKRNYKTSDRSELVNKMNLRARPTNT